MDLADAPVLYLRTALGSIVTFAAALSLATPEHVERWRVGAEAEKRTAKALRRLTKRGWVVMHDLPDDYGNRDHVAIAPSGKIFLLDTKAPGGRITIEHGVLRVRWLEDPDDGYDKDLTPRMKGAAFGLANDLAAALPHRPWVTPVVVIWGRWTGSRTCMTTLRGFPAVFSRSDWRPTLDRRILSVTRAWSTRCEHAHGARERRAGGRVMTHRTPPTRRDPGLGARRGLRPDRAGDRTAV